MRRRSLFLVALGSAYFWVLGALLNLNIDQFADKTPVCPADLRRSPPGDSKLLGIGGGALLAGIVSHGKVELGLVPLGGIGIALTSMLLVAVPAGSDGHFPIVGYGANRHASNGARHERRVNDIPLQRFCRTVAHPNRAARIMAAYNFLAFRVC